ncbi:MAG: zf-HC2 domain-containing protein [Acidobacteria bacterium]|nr:zf-HC2 domain-containing protein [Acidobacteriota bacterium]
MKCRDLQYELPLYADGSLSPSETAALDAHLRSCPLCRQKLADIHDLRSELRAMRAPAMPRVRLESIRSAVLAELSPAMTSPGFQLIETPRRWIDAWLMPYAVGSVASILLGVTMLWLILSPSGELQTELAANRRPAPSSAIMLSEFDPMAPELTPAQYVDSRFGITGESPSINPRGALVSLTRSMVRGDMKESEVVVIADVFGNGLARIAEVIEPSDNKQAIEELKKALQTDDGFTPFVPAEMDKRSDRMRVVLKIQTVDVDTRAASPGNGS